MKKVITLLSILFVGVTVPTILGVVKPSESELTERFERSFILIQQKKIAAFKDLDWCKTFEYQKGYFTNNNVEKCTYDFDQKKKFINFDSQAQSAFEEVQRSLSSPKVETLEVEFQRSGKIASAKLGVFAGDVNPVCKVIWSCNQKTYIYQPNYGKLPEDMGGEIWHEKIDQNWYIEWQDWN